MPGSGRRTAIGLATPLIGKAVRVATRFTGHGGSAFPGEVIERLDPGFLRRTLSQLPLGVVLVSGTNGKTTTTRMIASILSDLGLRVFTNPTGSNFTRGVVSALLPRVTVGGRLPADIAVLELDEAYAVRFVRQVRPRFALLLNVMRDQLDRFGEIDNTARLLGEVARATTGVVVLNREDSRIAALARLATPPVHVRYFGLDPSLRSLFPSDDEMHGSATFGDARRAATAEFPAADVTLTRVGDQHAEFLIDGRRLAGDVKLSGAYNLFNAAAALTVVRAVTASMAKDRRAVDPKAALPTAPDGPRLLRALGRVTPAFGRGESIDYHGAPIDLVLVKNPMGFRLSLVSFDPRGRDTMIAINDDYADGRDMSWLWDVDFTSLHAGGVAMVTGVRAWDMALRLGYDQVPIGQVNRGIASAVRAFAAADPGRPKRIYCTYTAMLACRSALASLTPVADAGL